MKSVLKMLCLVAVVGFVSSVLVAADKPKADKVEMLHGKVVKVDGTTLVVSVKEGKDATATEVKVATDDKTVVTIDGKDAKLADLKAGMRAMVTPKTGTATKIAAKSEEVKKGDAKAPAAK